MPIFDCFSSRMKRQRGEVPEVYRYNVLPDALKTQIVMIWRAALGQPRRDFHGWSEASLLWSMIVDTLREERGAFVLSTEHNGEGEWELELAHYFLTETNVELALDVVEAIFIVIASKIDDNRWAREADQNGRRRPEVAVDDLNARLKQHGVGFQFENGRIMRVDSQFEHQRVVVPALALLRDKAYAGANDEFMRAHEHHRHGRQKECVADCLKAFESTMKVICARRKWAHDKNATAKGLIDTCLKNGLMPTYRESDLAGFRTLLDALLAVRNKTSGHGQGEAVVEVPAALAAYALHLAAANILLMVESDRAFGK